MGPKTYGDLGPEIWSKDMDTGGAQAGLGVWDSAVRSGGPSIKKGGWLLGPFLWSQAASQAFSSSSFSVPS